MRIFLSCQQALKPHAVPAYGFWEHYFRNALKEAGHELIETPDVDWAEGLTPMQDADRARWMGRTWQKTVDFLRGEHSRRPVDFFLGYLFPYQVEPSAVRTIRSLGIPTVNFFCDNMREFARVPESYGDFDLHWVPEAEARPMYAQAHAPFLYAPMPMWVPLELRNVPQTETESVVFLGSHDLLREDLLGNVIRKGTRLQVYGAGWGGDGGTQTGVPVSVAGRVRNQLTFVRREGLRGFAMRATYQLRTRGSRDWEAVHARPAVPMDDYLRVTRESRVVIGINRCPGFRRPFWDSLRYSRLRDIEAPMLGACYLTETAPGLEDLYDIGAEIETYRDAAELADKIERLQADPTRRLQLRQRGQRRALSDHTIERTLGRLAEKLGIPPRDRN